MPIAELAPILSRLDRHMEMFDLTRDSLGEDLCEIASVGAHDALTRGEDVDGNALAPLSPAYDAWKSRHYPGLPIGFKDLEMGRLDNFRGTVDVTADAVSVEYGLNDQAKDELDMFCQGDPSRNRPARNVWGFTDESLKNSTQRTGDHFQKHI
jgi:hypothetical protein